MLCDLEMHVSQENVSVLELLMNCLEILGPPRAFLCLVPACLGMIICTCCWCAWFFAPGRMLSLLCRRLSTLIAAGTGHAMKASSNSRLDQRPHGRPILRIAREAFDFGSFEL